MADTLLQTYLPLMVWPVAGLMLLRILPETLPRLLGRGLYWVGVPLEIFVLARQADLSQQTGFAPLFTALALGLGLGFGGISAALLVPKEVEVSQQRARQGSWLLSSTLGNTGFVGLAIAPSLISDPYLGWVVFYSVTHNLLGTYGIGVILASYFGHTQQASGWNQLKALLTVPSLWAFALGFLSRPYPLADPADTLLAGCVPGVIAAALALMGMRLSQIQGWRSLKLALPPALIKAGLVPLAVGAIGLGVGLPAEATLAMVLMSGMPTAFGSLILAEEYGLDRDLIAGSIALSSPLLLATVPLWLLLFSGGHGG